MITIPTPTNPLPDVPGCQSCRARGRCLATAGQCPGYLPDPIYIPWIVDALSAAVDDWVLPCSIVPEEVHNG